MADSFRNPIVSILGHVDHGKTAMLNSFVSEKERVTESTGITQSVRVKSLDTSKWNRISEPIIFVDTPGHRAFQMSRRNGGELADIALLVIDVNKGFDEQTHEILTHLRESKTPFIVALNKVDALPEWENRQMSSAKQCYSEQSERAKERVNSSYYSVISTLSDNNINGDFYWNIEDFTKTVPIFLTSAKTEMGLDEVLNTISALSDEYLGQQRKISTDAKAEGSVVNVGHMDGIGGYMDVLLTDGSMELGDKLFFGTKEGIRQTSIRKLIDIQKSSSNQKEYVESCVAGAHVRLVYSGQERPVSGSPLSGDRDELNNWLPQKSKQNNTGIVVKAGSVSGLDAVVNELNTSDIEVSTSDVGLVNKTAVRRAQALDKKDQIIVFFQTEITEKAEELAREESVRIVTSDVIYELVEMVEEIQEEIEDDEDLFIPSEAAVIDIFAQDTEIAVIGLSIYSGSIQAGDTLIQFSNDSERYVGSVSSIRKDDNPVEYGTAGEEVSVEIKKSNSGKINRNSQLYKRITEDDIKNINENELNELERETLEKYTEMKQKRNPFWG